MPTIQFPSETDKLAYWAKHRPLGAPDEVQDKYLDFIESSLDGETWEDFTARHDAIRGNYERASDVTSAIHGSEKFVLPSGTETTSLDGLLARCAPLWRSEQSVGFDSWMRWLKLAPIFHFIPSTTDDRVAEFAWARVRCFISGAGYQLWQKLCEELCDTYPACPFDAQEDEDAWKKGLLKAHSSCGWPVQIAWLPWSLLSFELGAKDDKVPQWLKMLALLHVLKHVRYSASQGIVVHFGGVSTIVTPEPSNAIGSWARARHAILGSVGAKLPGGRQPPPVAASAVEGVLAHLEVNHLLRKEPIGALPANLLAGPWTMPVPDHTCHEGFYQTGLRLSGLWSANDGRVSKDSMGQSDVLRYDWNCLNPASFSKERDLFVLGLPATYDKSWPSDVFQDAFPNLDLSWVANDTLSLAAKAYLDAPIAASLVRSKRPEFLSEYPAIVFMPSDPSPQNSTNQGKSQAALVYARATNPAITRLVSINDSSSAPDIRTVAGEIRSTGSIAIDEFRPPKNQTHIFAHDNMQALCTGSSVASGRVYENDGTVSLRSSPVFSAKVYEVPTDIQNRSLAHWLGSLTDEMRARTKILEDIRTGALSIRMRLGMHAFLEETTLLDDYVASGRQSSSRGLRFDAHRTLAACILRLRASISMEEAYAALDQVCQMMQGRLRNHVQMAEDSGLTAAMEFGSSLRLRLSYIFDDLGMEEFTQFRQTANALAASKPSGVAGGLSAKDILSSWGSLHDMEGAPYQDYLKILTGSKRHVSNRAVVMALKSSLDDTLPAEGAQWLIPGDPGILHGWAIRRGKKDSYHFVCTHPAKAAT